MRFTGGWVKLWRSMDSHWTGQDGWSWAIFTKLIMWAYYKDKKTLVNGKVTEIKRGQVVTSAAEIANKLGFHRSTVEKRLKMFEEEGMIEQQVSFHGRIITILNYDKYQGGDDDDEQPDVQHDVQPHVQQSVQRDVQRDVQHRVHRVKNIKQLKKERRKEEYITPTPTDVEVVSEVKENPARSFIAHYCEAYKAKYKTNPVIDGRAAGIAQRIVKSIGLEKAKLFIERYLEMNDQWFITKHHDLHTFEGNLNKVAVFEGTGQRITARDAKQADVTQKNQAGFNFLLSELKKKRGEGHEG
jgi:DNA-binding transcriptional regulator YhcF (GntR family)